MIALFAAPVLLAGLVVLLVVLLRRPGGQSGPGDAPDALAVLDMRFARGEIDADEYRARRGLLART